MSNKSAIAVLLFVSFLFPVHVRAATDGYGKWNIGNYHGVYAAWTTGIGQGGYDHDLLVECDSSAIRTKIHGLRGSLNGFGEFRVDRGAWEEAYFRSIKEPSGIWARPDWHELANGNHPAVQALITGNRSISFRFYDDIFERTNTLKFSLKGSTKAITELLELCGNQQEFRNSRHQARDLIGYKIKYIHGVTFHPPTLRKWDERPNLAGKTVEVLDVANDIDLNSQYIGIPNIMLRVKLNDGCEGFAKYGSFQIVSKPKIHDDAPSLSKKNAGFVSNEEIAAFCAEIFPTDITLSAQCATNLYLKRARGELKP